MIAVYSNKNQQV